MQALSLFTITRFSTRMTNQPSRWLTATTPAERYLCRAPSVGLLNYFPFLKNRVGRLGCQNGSQVDQAEHQLPGSGVCTEMGPFELARLPTCLALEYAVCDSKYDIPHRDESVHCQHSPFCGSVASSCKLLPSHTIVETLLILLLQCAVTLAYIASHNVAAIYHRRPFGDSSKACKSARSTAKGTLRVALTLWMGGCGTNITFTAARHPFCLVSGDSSGATGIDVGSACFLQRASVAASLLAL